jgi:hypothetical protein
MSSSPSSECVVNRHPQPSLLSKKQAWFVSSTPVAAILIAEDPYTSDIILEPNRPSHPEQYIENQSKYSGNPGTGRCRKIPGTCLEALPGELSARRTVDYISVNSSPGY